MLFVILDRPPRAVDDRLDRPAQLVALHHLHVDDLRIGRDAERRAGDRAGDGGAVWITDLWIARERRVAHAHASRELGMCVDTPPSKT